MIRAHSLWALVLLMLVGCEKSETVDSKSAANAESGVGDLASFKAGRGVQLAPETVNEMGIRTAEAEEHKIDRELEVTAQVYRSTPSVLASAVTGSSEADHVEATHANSAKLVSVDRSRENATHQVELLFALNEPHLVGDFVRISLKASIGSVLTVPRTALLDSARGTFVYVANGGAFLRTAVKTGAIDSQRVEITDGLYAGDVVVIASVERLWVTELRLAVADTD